MMTNDENEFMRDVISQASNKVELLQKTVIEKVVEIEKLKAENARLTAKLGQVLLSIDTVKEMNAMCNIDEQVKQAKIDVLNKLKDYVNQLACDEYGDSACDTNYVTIDIDKYEQDIDEMIAEVQNGGDKC